MKRNFIDKHQRGNPDLPKSSDEFTIITVESDAFAIVSPIDERHARTYADVVERPIIAFRVYANGRRAEPITIDGVNWSEASARWAIREPSGWVVDDAGRRHRCAQHYLHSLLDRDAA